MRFFQPTVLRNGSIRQYNEQVVKEQIETVCNITTSFEEPSSRKHMKNRSDEWHFISSGSSLIRSAYNIIIDVAKRKRKKLKILDLGCGLSPLLLFLMNNREAARFVQCIGGVEKNKRWVDFWKTKKYARIDVNVVQGDLLDMDDTVKRMISEADFIYTYQPIKDEALYTDFIKSTWGYMKPKACIYDGFGPIRFAIPSKFQTSSKDAVRSYYRKSE